MRAEITLFARIGPAGTSPWATARNVDGVHFSDPKYFTRYEGTTTDSGANITARQRQIAFVREAVQRLNGNTNFYWQVANESDQSPQSTTDVGIDATVNWHHDMAKLIFDTEALLPNKHLIGVNFWSKPALDRVAAGRLDPYVQIVNGHYTSIIPKAATPNTPLYGAIQTLSTYYGTLPTTVFGFNETKSTTFPSLVGARAEAWEHLLGHGAAYDNYNLDRSDPAGKTNLVLGYLGYLQQFLTRPNVAGRTLTLANFSRITGSASPAWASGLPAYPTTPAGGDGPNLGNTYWSSMQWLRQQYALYVHHSSTADPTGAVSRFKGYTPCYKASGYQNTLGLSLGSIAGWYTAEWFVPSTANAATPIVPKCVNNINWGGTGSPRINLTSPKYPYDLALRVERCPNGVGPCATEVSCAGLAVGPLPPDDPQREANCSMGS